MKISEQILDKVEDLKKTLIPNDVHVKSPETMEKPLLTKFQNY